MTFACEPPQLRERRGVRARVAPTRKGLLGTDALEEVVDSLADRTRQRPRIRRTLDLHAQWMVGRGDAGEVVPRSHTEVHEGAVDVLEVEDVATGLAVEEDAARADLASRQERARVDELAQRIVDHPRARLAQHEVVDLERDVEPPMDRRFEGQPHDPCVLQLAHGARP